jgi:TatD DNase family protein
LVDTHCHLGDSKFDSDRDHVLVRARAAGVAHVVVIADSALATERAIALATQYDLSATAGVHPHEASSWCDEVAARTSAALDHPAVVAVGETGLDYHYDHSPRDMQRRAFEAQLALAAERRLPVIVHAREADEDVAAMVAEWGGEVSALVLHSFSSGPAVFDAGMAVGAYFGFSGMVTFKNWTGTGFVTTCPRNRLLIETDAPYLSPVPHRGKRNEPAYVQHVAERVAELRQEPLELLMRETTANARACFGARVAQPHDTET